MPSLTSVLAGIPGYAGYRAAQEAGDERSMGELKQVAGAQGLLSAIAEEQRKRQAVAKQQKYEAAVAALGPEPTQEQLVSVAAQHGTPDKTLSVHQSSLDRQASLEAAKETRAAALEQAKSTATMAHEARMARLTSDAERRVETARHNTAMERIQLQIVGLRGAALDQSKPPSGYRKTADGNLEAIPGGPADTKIQGVLNQDTAQLESSTSGLNRMAVSANELLNHPGLKGITGLRGAIPNMPGTAAADAQAKLENLKSQVGFSVLQAMRDASKTGGTLGNVSDAEGKRLEENLAALQNAQSYEQFQTELKKILTFTGEAKDRLRNAYNLKHKDKPGAAPAAPAAAAAPSVESLLDKYK